MGYLSYPKDFAVLSEKLDSISAPLVSVVVPVYNTPTDKLNRCFRTLSNQTYKNIEIIIVDDGSKQVCFDCMKDIAAKDARVQIIKGGHKGVSSARNLGMKEAKGEWLIFSDADDENETTLIEEALSIALSGQCDLVCGSVMPLYVGDIKTSQPSDFLCYITDSSAGELESHSLALQMLGPVKYKSFTGPDFRGRGPVAKLYKTSLLEGLKFDCNISIGEDTLFNYRYLLRCGTVAIADRPWYWYYQNEGSAVHSTALENWTSSIDGILASRDDNEDNLPFISRCAFMATQGATGFIQENTPESKRDAAALLRYAYDKGCFGPRVFRGYVLSPWLKTMVMLCSKGLFRSALAFWTFKTRFSSYKNNRELLVNENSNYTGDSSV